MKAYSFAQYRKDAQFGFFMAVGVGIVSALPLAGIGLLNIWHQLGGQPLEMPWATFFATVLVVWAAYLLAGQLGAAAYFVLRPTQRFALGWVATGAAEAIAIWGTAGYMLAIFYHPVGQAVLRQTTEIDAWKNARSGTVVFAILGAAFGVYHAWRVRTGRDARDEAEFNARAT